jgi:hypothetical protein
VKRKHKKLVAIGAIVAGVIAFAIGAWVNHTIGPKPPMSDPNWFELSNARSNREMLGFILMGGGVFACIVAGQELYRQAMKLKKF